MPLKDCENGKMLPPAFKPFPVVKVLIATLLGGCVLYLLFKKIGPLTVLAELERVDKIKLVFAVSFIGLSYFCRAALWKRLLDQFGGYPYWAVFRSTMIGYLVNNILPARLGDVTRGAWLFRTRGGKSSFIFGSLALERVMDVSIILVMLGISLAWLGLYCDWLLWSSAFAGAVVSAFFVFAVTLKWLAGRDISSFPQEVVKVKEFLVRNTSLKNPRTVIKDLGDSVSFGNMRRGVLWSAVTWFVTFWGLYFSLDSLGLAGQIGIIRASVILCVASLGIAIPSLPAALGTYQAAFVFGATLAGLPETRAFSASFLYQGLWILVTSGFGLISLAWEGVGFKELITRIKGSDAAS